MSRIILLILISSMSLSVYASEETQLPVTKVILYKHGVGYFERSGTVQGDQQVVLSFSQEEMKDVLKTLIVLDLGGGKISQVVYDSKKPLNKLLEGYSLDLSGNRNMLSLLDQIKGAHVQIFTGPENIDGTLLGLRQDKEIKGDIIVEPWIVDLVTESGDLKSFSLKDVKQIALKDPEVHNELKELLDVIFKYRQKEVKRISVFCNGKGERDIVIGYVVETPVWKTSYRLVLDKEKKPYFQGWAIVDNIQDEEWKDVTLSLVSGLPISFIQDLYTPFFKERPVIEVEREGAVAPYMAEDGFGAGVECEMAMEEAPAKMRMMAAYKPKAAPLMFRRERMMDSADVQTVTQEAGDLFEYKIDHPITIGKNRSATIPIFSGEIQGERVSLYNENQRRDNPYSAIWLENSTGLTLEGGPLMVLEDDIYAGEALMDTLKPKQKALVSYAVDLGIQIDTTRKSETKSVYQVVIEKGTLYANYMKEDIKTYSIINKTDKKKTVIIEHPFLRDWKLVKPKEATEETKSYYRFSVTVEPYEKKEFPVIMECSFYQSYLIRNITSKEITYFISNKYITDSIKQALQNILTIKNEISTIKTKLSDTQSDVKEIFKNQERIRNNLKALRDTPAERKLAEDYVSKLSKQEKELESLEKKVEQLKEQNNSKQTELNTAISTLKFKRDL